MPEQPVPEDPPLRILTRVPGHEELVQVGVEVLEPEVVGVRDLPGLVDTGQAEGQALVALDLCGIDLVDVTQVLEDEGVAKFEQYASWLEEGAVKVKCETCHRSVLENPAHKVHKNTVDCTACHTQSIISCYNCHLQSEIQADVKRPHALLRDYMLLLRRKGSGKVYTGTIMTLNFNDKTFLAVAPYRAHTIARNAKKCEDCHDNAAIREYNQTGQITVTRWDGSRIVNTKGVIPVPPDWQTAFKLDFVDYTGDPRSATTDPTKWVFLKSGADGKQMLYAEPLTAQQLQKLSQPYRSD